MNKIHTTAIIGDQVKLGIGNTIGPYVVITGNVEIGDHNWIGPHSSIGGPAEIRDADLPQDWQVGNHQGTVTIGSNNVIRDACIIHAGYFTGTRIANHCYIMNQNYIAHDCNVGNQTTLSSNVALGGHVIIKEGANLGMGTIVHQRRIIGDSTMIGMGSIVTRDIQPFSKAYGNPCKLRGLNILGMQRSGYSEIEINQVADFLADKASVRFSTRLSTIFEEFQLVSGTATNAD